MTGPQFSMMRRSLFDCLADPEMRPHAGAAFVRAMVRELHRSAGLPAPKAVTLR